MQFKLKYLLVVLSLLLSVNISAQRTKRQVLEARRIQNQKDQIYINALLSNTKRKEKNLLNDLSDLKSKIKIRTGLITAITNEFKELGNEIYLNQLEINQNRRDLKALKKDYSEMIFKSYKSKSKNSRIMFLLSSENFYQGYKRFQYMKQYTSFRKKQGDEIQHKTTEIQELIDTLKLRKEQKQQLLTDKKKEQLLVEKEKKEQENLISQVKRKGDKYKKQIREFERREVRLNAQINKIIEDAIVASNKKAGVKSSKSAGFNLTPEAKKLASKFILNKGKLPWPVAKGYISTYYGNQPHPFDKNLSFTSHGLRITTGKGSKAKAIFDGTVLGVLLMPGNKKMILIQHGNYFTSYKNLENIFVKKGEKISTNQEIGTIFTDKVTGKTIISFGLMKNTKTENPVNWIKRRF